MYNTEIIFHLGSEREFTYHHDAATIQDAVRWLDHESQGMSMVVAYINNVRVTRRDGKGWCAEDGEPVCTNEKWHDVFAPQHLRIVPTNPATYQATGDNL